MNGTTEFPPDSITVIGFGLMGAQISQVLALSGFRVSAYDVNGELLKKGLDLIRLGKYGLEAAVSKSRITREEADKALARISTCASMEKALDHAQFLLEAAVENLKIKQSIFAKAAELADPGVVLASNTSTLSIAQIGGALRPKLQSRLAGMHFFNPPQVMKLVEVVRTRKTANDVIERIQSVSHRIGKTPVLVKDYPGFVANRIGISVFAEASELLELGVANVRDIDLSMKLGYGYPVGPFELGDLVGLDARLRNMKALYIQTKDKRFRPPKILRKLVSAGYLGDPKLKPGSRGGYYEYYGLKRPSEDHLP